MDPAFMEVAVAALGGASGGFGQAAATALWERLKVRFADDEEVTAALEARDPSDLTAVARLDQALRYEASVHPDFRDEMDQWWSQHGNTIPGTQVNTVNNSEGLNAPGGTFTGSVNVPVGQPERPY